MQEENSDQYRKMTETPVPKLIIRLGIPTTISVLVTNIYNIVDTWFVGRIGTSASGAVGVVFGLMSIIQAFGFMFGHGAGSMISRQLGAKNEKSATKIASTSFFASLAAGTMVCILGLLFLDPLMRLLGSTETILPYARIYGTYILLGAPFLASSCVMNNILRYEGQAAYAMIGLAGGSLLNILGDYILMEVFDMGIRGAGISTAFSQIVSFLVLLFMFCSGKTKSRFRIRQVGSLQDLFRICATGLPSLIRQGLGSVSTMVLNGCAGLYGDAAVAAMSIVNRICMLIFCFGLGLGQGFQPVSAFNYGAKKYSRVKAGYFFTLLASEVVLGTLAIIGMFFRKPLVGFFRSDPEVIAIGSVALLAQFVGLLFQPLTVCSNMLFQSIGKNRMASFLASLRSGLCFLPCVILFTVLFGLPGVEIGPAVSDVAAFAITLPFAVRFLRNLPADA